MKRAIGAVIALLLIGVGVVRADSSQDVVEVKMQQFAYAIHLHGSLVAGRAYIPVAFSVDESGKMSALVSGTRAPWQSRQMPPTGSAMVSALLGGETVGFKKTEVEKFGPGLLSTFRSALAEAPKNFASQPTIVLIRNTDLLDPASGQIVNKLDQEWEDALRKNYKRLHKSAHLLIIRLVFPNQPDDARFVTPQSGCNSKECGAGNRN